ncbi:MAG: GTPase Era [Thermodesulfobacteriota bacterium]
MLTLISYISKVILLSREIKIDEISNNYKSGFISVIGRPNVGKSTIVNSIVGEKVSAVSNKPNTTRNRITGILTSDNSQLIFLDTPGIHRARGKLQKAMVQTSMNSISEADLLLVLIDAQKPFVQGDKFIIENLPKPSILVINKIDLIKKPEILEIIRTASEYGNKFSEIIPVSALNRDGTAELVNIIIGNLPNGKKYFPDDMYTDQQERFLVAEIIREKIFNLTRDEIPYKTAVQVDEFRENTKKGIIKIGATIFVDKQNHKGIIIGKSGELLKTVGNQSRLEIERILGTKVFMELWVKVKEKWTENESLIKEIGYLS